MATPLRQPRTALRVAVRATRRAGAVRPATPDRRAGVVAVARRVALRAAREPAGRVVASPPWRRPCRTPREAVALGLEAPRRTSGRSRDEPAPDARRVAPRVAVAPRRRDEVAPVGVARMLRRRVTGV